MRSALDGAYGKGTDGEGACAAATKIDWVPSPNALGYRNRIRLRIAGRGQLGFFNEAKSTECAALEPTLRHWIERLRNTPSSASGAFAEFSHAEVRVPGLDGRPSAYFVRRDAQVPLSSGARAAISGLEDGGWWVDVEDLAAEGPAAGAHGCPVVQRYALRDSWWDVPLGAFMQINSAVNELLVEHAVVGAVSRGLESFADLFSGAGNFALPLARSGLRGIAVESNPRAAGAARRSAHEQGLARLDALAADARGWAEDAARSASLYDVVILDPPRAGLKCGARSCAALARSHILLCSCNPKTLAVDLLALAAAHFRVEAVTAFDMFPATEHVEVAVWLRREC